MNFFKKKEILNKKFIILNLLIYKNKLLLLYLLMTETI